jgi:hypothetical protein
MPALCDVPATQLVLMPGRFAMGERIANNAQTVRSCKERLWKECLLLGKLYGPLKGEARSAFPYPLKFFSDHMFDECCREH